MIAVLLRAGKVKILSVSALLLLITCLVDWAVGHNVSLAALYILPMMLAAIVFRPAETAVAAVACSYLRSQFDTSGSPIELTLRFIFAALAYFLSGLFVTVLLRNQQLEIEHLASMQVEQTKRREAEEQLRLLAESSPAAILTTDGKGIVLAGNSAAHNLFGIPNGEPLRGRNIGQYLPVLRNALRLEVAREGLRTAAKCQGYRENGEIFQAHSWFSSYVSEAGPRLAAIVVDSSEEMRDREHEGLQQLMRGNRIAAAAVAHEVRNFCGAIALRCGNLSERYGMGEDPDFAALNNLVMGLQAIASLELKGMSNDQIERVHIREVLNDLRILIEPDWRDIEGTVRWDVPDDLPLVAVDPHGLLQAFLNLSQNSHRAVQAGAIRELSITASGQPEKVVVRFCDTGPGIADPSRLFQPFQRGATGTGMGLYVSRTIVRSYGGELAYEHQASGACFVIELDSV